MRRKLLYRAAVIAAFSIGALGARSASAQTFGYCDFSNVSTLTLNGSAVQSADLLSLTSDDTWTSGSAFVTTPLVWSSTTSFSTTFSFALEPSGTHGEGISFIIQNDGVDALGGVGGGIGYGLDGDLTGGITPGLEIEFDTYFDIWDPNGNHVALTENGDDEEHIAYATPSFTMLGGGLLYAWIDYDAPSTELDVYLAQSASKPASPLLTTTVSIASIVGSQAFVGFTASTGSQLNEQDIDDWEFSTLGDPCVCAGSAECGGATPVCDSVTLTCVAVAPQDAGIAPPGMDASVPEEASTPDAGIIVIADAAPDQGAPNPALDSGLTLDASIMATVDSGGQAVSPPPTNLTQLGDIAGSACSCRVAGAPSGPAGGALALLGLLLCASTTLRRRRTYR
jgi:hypothetical protein